MIYPFKGIVDGISENVDLDFGFKDYTQYITPRTYSAEGYTKDNGCWVKNNTGWWYCHFDGMIIPGLSEPPVRTLRATIPENENHIFR